MGRMVVAMGGQKGGAGKSTVAISLAVALQADGVMVELVDADPQRTLGTWYTQRAAREEGGSMVLHCPAEGELLDLVQRLRQQEGDGVVIIDLDGRNSESQRAAMVCADIFLIPIRAGVLDVWAMGDMLPLLEQAKQYNPKLEAYAVLNSMDRTQIARDVRGALRNVAIKVLDTELGYRVDYRESVGFGQGPTDYDQDSKAAREVRALVRELLLIGQRLALKETAA